LTEVKIPWNSKGGGVIAVMKAFEFKKLEADIALIKGHAGPVVDFEFSPYNDSLLATASQDGTVKLW
jgi:coronin-1B/1C/6